MEFLGKDSNKLIVAELPDGGVMLMSNCCSHRLATSYPGDHTYAKRFISPEVARLPSDTTARGIRTPS